ncbi:MAG: putative baseplate assembly protein [Gemmatimonadaceae bacterium]|nr:putative baseplate assembly protein [Gemmatimonadaceae bacterium]
MPPAHNLPVIDNRRYDDLFTELRTRIPRYTPEWTDFNDSDPGITLVQLFAWLGDMLLYRMGQVPELNYLKFLELLGIELRAAEPAIAEITFPLAAAATQPFVIIPRRTQVTAEAPGSPAPVVFETDRAITAIAARLSSVQAFDGFAFEDLSAANTSALESFAPFGNAAGIDSALYLGFETAAPFPQVELDLAFVTAAASAPKSVNCASGTSARFASARMVWEYWNGSDWRPLDLLVDETLAFTRSGHVRLKTPAAGVMVADVIGEVAAARTWIRARLVQAQYERAPQLRAIRTNTVSATQAQTVRNEVLGGSDGRANQVFRLASAPVLAGTLRLEVNEGDGFAAWTEVTDFFGAAGRDRVFALDRTTGEVRFGDGNHGAIPVGNSDLPASNIVAREYRFGGGTAGNLAAGAIKTLVGSITGVDANAITNQQPSVGGRAEESLAEAKLRAPSAIRSRGRAVTAQDYEQLAIEAGTIRRAKALPLSHPDFPGVQVPGVVSMIVVPDGTAPNPVPSEGTLRMVCAALEPARVITTELYVVPPVYRQVRVTTDVVVDDRADLAAVKTAITSALLQYFHPLVGGEDGQGWPFGGDIFYSRVYGRATVPGVQSIERLVIALDGIEAAPCTNVALCDGELAYSVDHVVRVAYASGS